MSEYFQAVSYTHLYGYKDYFTLNANTRYDGSNKFGSRSNEKLLPVWSVSGLVDLKTVSGLQLSWLESFSVKGSYGEQGNMLDGQTPVPVSYTHLDVYKRQVVCLERRTKISSDRRADQLPLPGCL